MVGFFSYRRKLRKSRMKRGAIAVTAFWGVHWKKLRCQSPRTKLIHDRPAKAPINIWNRGPFVKRHQQFPNSTSLIGVFLRLRQSVIGCCAKLSHPACQSSPSVSINLHFPPLLGKHPKRFLPPKITFFFKKIGDTINTGTSSFMVACFSILSCWFSGGVGSWCQVCIPSVPGVKVGPRNAHLGPPWTCYTVSHR